MKKIFLILLVCLFALTGCQDEKKYSQYSMYVPVDSWVGAPQSDYNIMAGFLLSDGFVFDFRIDGDDTKANDEQALRMFREKVELLYEYDLTEVMVGATSPGSLQFSYVLAAGSQYKEVAYESFSVDY